MAVTQASAVGHLRLHTAGTTVPHVAAINYRAGKTRSNNAVVALDPSGRLAVYSGQPSGSVHLILDVTGYFE